MIAEKTIKIVCFDPAWTVKITVGRPVGSGWVWETRTSMALSPFFWAVPTLQD